MSNLTFFVPVQGKRMGNISNASLCIGLGGYYCYLSFVGRKALLQTHRCVSQEASDLLQA